MAGSDARQLSDGLVVVASDLSVAFGALQKERQQEAARVRDAIGYLYAALLRPLWKAFPELLPEEMRP